VAATVKELAEQSRISIFTSSQLKSHEDDCQYEHEGLVCGSYHYGTRLNGRKKIFASCSSNATPEEGITVQPAPFRGEKRPKRI
jgi:hypothetical protein